MPADLSPLIGNHGNTRTAESGDEDFFVLESHFGFVLKQIILCRGDVRSCSSRFQTASRAVQ